MKILKHFRIILHSDPEGYPDCWLIQEKYFWQKHFRFRVGYFPSREEALKYLHSHWFDELKGMVHSPESLATYYNVEDDEQRTGT